MLRIDIVDEPRGNIYHRLLNTCATWCETGLLVVRDESELNTRGQTLIASIEHSIIRSDHVGEWPGTRLVGRTALVYEFRLNSFVVHALQRAVNGLYEWVEPLPEDLCLLGTDRVPVLVTVAHEQDAFMDVTEEQLGIIQENVPGLRWSARGEDGARGAQQSN